MRTPFRHSAAGLPTLPPGESLSGHPVLRGATREQLHHAFTLAGVHLIDYLHTLVSTGTDPDTGTHVYAAWPDGTRRRVHAWHGVTWDDMARTLMHMIHARAPQPPRDADGRIARARRIDPDTALDWRELMREHTAEIVREHTAEHTGVDEDLLVRVALP